ncbi:MAG: hypothetical protein Q7S59_05945 [Sulfurimonas sp.]|nr:hypothetical protein [Sulfurimonas sp.]
MNICPERSEDEVPLEGKYSWGANGLIREYFPKQKKFQEITDKEVVDVQNRLNNRPRKILDYKTPAEVFFDTITKSLIMTPSKQGV